MFKKLFIVTILFNLFFTQTALANGLTPGTPEYMASLLDDLEYRQSLPQTDVPYYLWYTDPHLQKWGPLPRQYPSIDNLINNLPDGTDINQWKRDRVVAIAKTYINLPYRHHHIPAWSPTTPNAEGLTGPGLDCSNFTSWVYDFGFGIMINSDVVKQSQMMPRSGYFLPPDIKRLEPNDDFLPGDLLFIMKKDYSVVSHVVIYIDENNIIDSTNRKVAVRPFKGWYRTHLSHGLRFFN